MGNSYTRQLVSFVEGIAKTRTREEEERFDPEGTSYQNAEINDDTASEFDRLIIEARQLMIGVQPEPEAQ